MLVYFAAEKTQQGNKNWIFNFKIAPAPLIFPPFLHFLLHLFLSRKQKFPSANLRSELDIVNKCEFLQPRSPA